MPKSITEAVTEANQNSIAGRLAETIQTTRLDFARLREVNVRRCEASFHPLNSWSTLAWAGAAAGEAGEAANAAKKIKRHDDKCGTGTAFDQRARKHLVDHLADEIADAIICLDLLAAREGIDISHAIRRKFNIVSERVGSPERL